MKELVKKRFDQIKELSHEINHDDLAYYFKGNTAIERFDYFNNGKELFTKTQSRGVELQEAKELQNVFNSNLNKTSR